MKSENIRVVAIPYETGTPTDEMIWRHAKAIARRLTVLGPHNSELQKVVRSIGSGLCLERTYRQFGRFLEVNKKGNLKKFPPEMADLFLLARSQNVSAQTLNVDRWALEFLVGRKLRAIPADRPQELIPRALFQEHVTAIIQAQRPDMAFSTKLAYACGLRCVELITMAPESLRPRDPRPIPPYLFHLADGERRTTPSKGGLTRWVLVPNELIKELESTRRKRPAIVRHEGRIYTSYYDIPGGRAWATDFSRTCRRLFGSSPGSHGLRHSYVLRRLARLLEAGLTELEARKAVSVEIGHFRPTVIDWYTRGYCLPDMAVDGVDQGRLH